MNELKTGHQVLVWENNDAEKHKAIYLFYDRRLFLPHHVLMNGMLKVFKYAELDPEATSFLPGDEVFNPDYPSKPTMTYVGYNMIDKVHVVASSGGWMDRWDNCQYLPKQEYRITGGNYFTVENSDSVTVKVPQGYELILKKKEENK